MSPVISRVSGHFGEWMQGRLGPAGTIALLTVACPALAVEVTRLGDGPLALEQDGDVLPLALAERLLDALGRPSGRFRVRAEMPVGGGAGASTAALLALAGAAGREDDPERLAKACCSVESATDPLMLDAPDAVLWSPRQGRSLRPLPCPRRAVIVGGFWGPPERTDPSDTAFPDISDLVDAWAGAVSLPEQARIASRSAERCTALRGPTMDPMPGLAEELGALGHLRAHTGSARGLIFAPGTVPEGAEEAVRRAGCTEVLSFATGAGG